VPSLPRASLDQELDARLKDALARVLALEEEISRLRLRLEVLERAAKSR
jgi:hypothetical protein